jgi:hypothetical protein
MPAASLASLNYVNDLPRRTKTCDFSSVPSQKVPPGIAEVD